jgi:hypothetical protein
VCLVVFAVEALVHAEAVHLGEACQAT